MSDTADDYRRSLDREVLELAERLVALAARLRALEPVDDEAIALATAMEGIAQKVYGKARLAAEVASAASEEPPTA